VIWGVHTVVDEGQSSGVWGPVDWLASIFRVIEKNKVAGSSKTQVTKLPYNTMPYPRGRLLHFISLFMLFFLKCLVFYRESNQFKKCVEITIGIYYWWDTTDWYRISESFLSNTGTQCEPLSVTLWIYSLQNSQFTSSFLINFHSKTFYHTVLYIAYRDKLCTHVSADKYYVTGESNAKSHVLYLSHKYINYIKLISYVLCSSMLWQHIGDR
jgi:hypothetical protein